MYISNFNSHFNKQKRFLTLYKDVSTVDIIRIFSYLVETRAVFQFKSEVIERIQQNKIDT